MLHTCNFLLPLHVAAAAVLHVPAAVFWLSILPLSMLHSQGQLLPVVVAAAQLLPAPS